MEFESQIDLENYALLDRIGDGATSEVYKIKDNKTGKIYAAKLLKKPISEITEDDNLNLNRELNIMAKISHPNIVKFIGFSPINTKKEDKPVIITELVSNGTLENLIKK